MSKRGHTSINGEYFVKPPELNELILETETALARSQELIEDGEHTNIGINEIDDKIQYEDPELVIVCPRPIHSGQLRLGYRTKA